MSEILHKDNIKWVLHVLKVKDIQECDSIELIQNLSKSRSETTSI